MVNPPKCFFFCLIMARARRFAIPSKKKKKKKKKKNGVTGNNGIFYSSYCDNVSIFLWTTYAPGRSLVQEHACLSLLVDHLEKTKRMRSNISCFGIVPLVCCWLFLVLWASLGSAHSPRTTAHSLSSISNGFCVKNS